MEQTVYIDLFFIINFSMDFLCLFLTARLLSYDFSMLRATLAAVLGGVYACAALLFSAEGLWGILADTVACVAMGTLFIYKKGQRRGILGFSVVYAACSIVLGGFMTVLYSFFNRLGLYRLVGEEDAGDGISVWLFALLAAVSGVMSLLGVKTFRKKASRLRGQVEITFGGRKIKLDAICDSGNMLSDPISGKPCIVVDKRAVSEAFPLRIEKMINGEMGAAGRIRIIPVHTVSGGGIVYAVRADSLRVNMGKGWWAVDALVAISELDGAQGAKALIPSSLASGAP